MPTQFIKNVKAIASAILERQLDYEYTDFALAFTNG